MKGLGPPDEARVAQAEADLDTVFALYDKILAKQKYLAGDDLTLVDLFHLPNASALKEVGYKGTFEKYPKVDKWFKGLQERLGSRLRHWRDKQLWNLGTARSAQISVVEGNGMFYFLKDYKLKGSFSRLCRLKVFRCLRSLMCPFRIVLQSTSTVLINAVATQPIQGHSISGFWSHDRLHLGLKSVVVCISDHPRIHTDTA